MPASYAHYRFGKLLLPQLPADIRQNIQRFRRMYDLGLQGPDFFFYYNPFANTATGQLGRHFHRQTGQDFFSAACKADASDAAQAYLYGLLGHYCLDSHCHPFIQQLVTIEEARHIPLESQFERFLLTLDGETSPQTFDISRFFRLTRGESMTIAEFYPGTTGGKVLRSIRSMAFFLRFLALPDDSWQMRLLKKTAPGFLDHKIPAEEDTSLAPYLGTLQDLYGQALEHYPEMLSQLTAFQKTGTALGELFAPDFG